MNILVSKFLNKYSRKRNTANLTNTEKEKHADSFNGSVEKNSFLFLFLFYIFPRTNGPLFSINHKQIN